MPNQKLVKTLSKIGPADKDIHIDALFMRGLADDSDEARYMRDKLRAAKPLFDIVKSFIQSQFDATVSVRSGNYSDQNWLAEQAHRNGKLEAFEQIWKLLP